jgi:hypothetical protein
MLTEKTKKLDGIWTIEQIEGRMKAYGRTDPNFQNWLRSLTTMERRYALGYLIDRLESR